MKKLVISMMLLCTIGLSATQAQAVKKAAKDVGNKTAETASKAKSAVVDQVYKGKCGPDGQTIYIDNHDKYYWVDKKGKKQYIAKAMLKDKS